MSKLLRAAMLAAACLLLTVTGSFAAERGSRASRGEEQASAETARPHARRHAKAKRHHSHRVARSDEPRRKRHAHAKAKRRHHVADANAERPSRRRHTADREESGGTVGMASYYWEPQALASGGRFNPNALTAAHKTLPFGTRVRVTHLGNGRSVNVTINDRGPYVGGRIIDLSKAAASAINMTGQGVARIKMTVIGR